MQIDVQAVANYVLDHADCDDRYEADEYVVELLDVRWYVERKRRYFVLHTGLETLRLPRC